MEWEVTATASRLMWAMVLRFVTEDLFLTHMRSCSMFLKQNCSIRILCEGIAAFKISAVPIYGKPQIIRNGNVFSIVAIFLSVIEVFMMAGTVSAFG